MQQICTIFCDDSHTGLAFKVMKRVTRVLLVGPTAP
jgi:hypothetical protein